MRCCGSTDVTTTVTSRQDIAPHTANPVMLQTEWVLTHRTIVVNIGRPTAIAMSETLAATPNHLLLLVWTTGPPTTTDPLCTMLPTDPVAIVVPSISGRAPLRHPRVDVARPASPGGSRSRKSTRLADVRVPAVCTRSDVSDRGCCPRGKGFAEGMDFSTTPDHPDELVPVTLPVDVADELVVALLRTSIALGHTVPMSVVLRHLVTRGLAHQDAVIAELRTTAPPTR